VLYTFPSINDFQPASGSAGAVVKIRGDHFVYASEVQFSGVAAALSDNFFKLYLRRGSRWSGHRTNHGNEQGTTTGSAGFTVLA
jgi:hypothetical protein